jgi:hypothetical protein
MAAADERDLYRLKTQIEAFFDAPFVSSSEDAPNMDFFNEISAKSREFQAIFDRCLDTVENEKQEIVLLRDMVMKLQMQMVGVSDDGSSLAALHEKYLSLENEFQVTLFESKIYELSQYNSPAALPQLVLNLVELSKNSNLKVSKEIKLKDYLFKVTGDIQAKLLDALRDTEESEDTSEITIAYSLLALLPIYLTDRYASDKEYNIKMKAKYLAAVEDTTIVQIATVKSILEYSRDSKVIDDIMRALSEATRVTRRLRTLCSALHDCGYLQQFNAEIHYFDVGFNFCREKIVGFLQLHVLTSMAIIESTHCMLLVETVLELDYQWMTTSLTTIIAASTTRPTSISSCLHDIPNLFDVWLENDRLYFENYLIKSFNNTRYTAYQFHMHQCVDKSTAKSSAKCYYSLYECYHTLDLAIERYKVLNCPAMEDSFSRCILEPILCIASALLVIRLRKDEIDDGILESISNGMFPKYYLAIPDRSGASSARYKQPKELEDFLDSIHYYQLSLDTYDSTARSLRCNYSRFASLWKELFQSHLPRSKLVDDQAIEAVFHHCFARAANNNYLFNPHDESVQNTLGYVLDTARGQVSNMACVLAKKWENISCR